MTQIYPFDISHLSVFFNVKHIKTKNNKHPGQAKHINMSKYQNAAIFYTSDSYKDICGQAFCGGPAYRCKYGIVTLVQQLSNFVRL